MDGLGQNGGFLLTFRLGKRTVEDANWASGLAVTGGNQGIHPWCPGRKESPTFESRLLGESVTVVTDVRPFEAALNKQSLEIDRRYSPFSIGK